MFSLLACCADASNNMKANHQKGGIQFRCCSSPQKPMPKVYDVFRNILPWTSGRQLKANAMSILNKDCLGHSCSTNWNKIFMPRVNIFVRFFYMTSGIKIITWSVITTFKLSKIFIGNWHLIVLSIKQLFIFYFKST